MLCKVPSAFRVSATVDVTNVATPLQQANAGSLAQAIAGEVRASQAQAGGRGVILASRLLAACRLTASSPPATRRWEWKPVP